MCTPSVLHTQTSGSSATGRKWSRAACVPASLTVSIFKPYCYLHNLTIRRTRPASLDIPITTYSCPTSMHPQPLVYVHRDAELQRMAPSTRLRRDQQAIVSVSSSLCMFVSNSSANLYFPLLLASVRKASHPWSMTSVSGMQYHCALRPATTSIANPAFSPTAPCLYLPSSRSLNHYSLRYGRRHTRFCVACSCDPVRIASCRKGDAITGLYAQRY